MALAQKDVNIMMIGAKRRLAISMHVLQENVVNLLETIHVIIALENV